MGVFKNDVGRPSNKTIILRRILKVVVFLVIIIGAGFIGYNLKDNDKIENNDEVLTEENTDKENETKKLDIAKAEEIMNDFFNDEIFFDNFDVETFNSDKFKTVYAIMNTTPTKSSYTCKELFGNDLESYNDDDDKFWRVRISNDSGLLCEDNVKQDYYAYSDVEKTFAKMFSEGKVVKDFVSIGIDRNYAYSKSKDLYTFLSCECGDVRYSKVYGITGASQNKNNIYINFKIAIFEPSDDENVYIGIDDFGNNVTMSAKDILDNNIDKLTGKYNTYTFTFEKVNNEYKFVEVK